MQIINNPLHHDENTPVPFTATPNFDNKKLKAKYLVIHYTAGVTAPAVSYMVGRTPCRRRPLEVARSRWVSRCRADRAQHPDRTAPRTTAGRAA